MNFDLMADPQNKTKASIELTPSGNCIIHVKSADEEKELIFSITRGELDDIHALSMNRRS